MPKVRQPSRGNLGHLCGAPAIGLPKTHGVPLISIEIYALKERHGGENLRPSMRCLGAKQSAHVSGIKLAKWSGADGVVSTMDRIPTLTVCCLQ